MCVCVCARGPLHQFPICVVQVIVLGGVRLGVWGVVLVVCVSVSVSGVMFSVGVYVRVTC